MSKFVRVEGGIVREVLLRESLPPFHPDIRVQFHEVEPDSPVDLGWLYADGQFSEPVIEEPVLELSDSMKLYLFGAIQQHGHLLDPDEIFDMIGLQSSLEVGINTVRAMMPEAMAQKMFAAGAASFVQQWTRRKQVDGAPAPLPEELEAVRTQLLTMCAEELAKP